ncbi:MAG TPA: extracellular solute-binding protein [Amaricoccus sp.]|uniref:extracellular solute-binding protein n=1 Tax=Amaricoccus sp. TaxID=1872485 RepID=UPI002C53734F|nr:extracellular solute-binding protein [Amaricoccus sp.]HMQ93709.1 extracellular solute-binding protein [Amaricoccus sp.]HMR52826.1 extracellular solute-binding protein [Amaricoccus sp.]HMR60236.1 extracellular solute-binding protein [Amaricoccus sp.]HMT99761.1 extracellular solute-binding protein [Amaricoccus sp.]
MPLLRQSVVGFVLAVWAFGPASAQGDEGIVVYTSQHAALTQAWAAAFTEETGIPVTIRKGTDTVMANQIIQEGENSPADVFLTENSPAMVLVERAGLFAPVAASTLERVPEEFRPASGMWTGIAARTTVFAYNTELLDEADLPGSMLDLAGHDWEGRWGAAPAGADFQAIVSALLQLRGSEETADWLAGLKRNALAYRGNFEAMRGANVGEVEGALIYHYYYFGDRDGTGESSDKLALHHFGDEDPGAFVSVSGAGVLASSSHPDAAQAFLAFVTGPGGQAILRDGDSFEYAIASGVEAHPALPPLDGLDYPKVDPSLLNASEVVALMTASGVF